MHVHIESLNVDHFVEEDGPIIELRLEVFLVEIVDWEVNSRNIVLSVVLEHLLPVDAAMGEIYFCLYV